MSAPGETGRTTPREMFGFCEGFRMPAPDDGSTYSRAGVRSLQGRKHAGRYCEVVPRGYGDLSGAGWVSKGGEGDAER